MSRAGLSSLSDSLSAPVRSSCSSSTSDTLSCFLDGLDHVQASGNQVAYCRMVHCFRWHVPTAGFCIYPVYVKESSVCIDRGACFGCFTLYAQGCLSSNHERYCTVNAKTARSAETKDFSAYQLAAVYLSQCTGKLDRVPKRVSTDTCALTA